jgi:hypothetical protein
MHFKEGCKSLENDLQKVRPVGACNEETNVFERSFKRTVKEHYTILQNNLVDQKTGCPIKKMHQHIGLFWHWST